VAGWWDTHRLVGDQGHNYFGTLCGPEQYFLDHPGAGICVDPYFHFEVIVQSGVLQQAFYFFFVSWNFLSLKTNMSRYHFTRFID